MIDTTSGHSDIQRTIANAAERSDEVTRVHVSEMGITGLAPIVTSVSSARYLVPRSQLTADTRRSFTWLLTWFVCMILLVSLEVVTVEIVELPGRPIRSRGEE